MVDSKIMDPLEVALHGLAEAVRDLVKAPRDAAPHPYTVEHLREQLAAAKTMLAERDEKIRLTAQTARDRLSKIEHLERQLADVLGCVDRQSEQLTNRDTKLDELKATVSNRDRTIEALTRTVEDLRREIEDRRGGDGPVDPATEGQ